MRIVVSIVFSFFFMACLYAQPTKTITNKDSYGWMFGASWVLTDDDGEAFNPFLVQNLHGQFYPSRLSVDKYIYDGWSAEAVVAFSSYNAENTTNDTSGISGSLFSMDFHAKYSLYKLLNRGAIDPFAFSGLGLSMRNNNDERAKAVSPTINIGLGINFWISNHIGIQLSSTAKIGVIDFFKYSDYMQHSIGIVARFDDLKSEDNEFTKSRYKISKRRKKIKHVRKKKKDDS